MFKQIAAALALFALVTACDEAPSPEPVMFRGEDELEYYSSIVTWDGHEIHASDYAEAVLVCSKVEDPKLILTLAAYEADPATDLRNIGFGSGMMAHGALLECLKKRWAANKAIDLL